MTGWTEAKQRKLCMELVHAEDETKVRKILQKFELWDNEDLWVDYGEDEYNYRTIGNQQDKADTALVEKVINSIDAVIEKEAKVRGITPEDPEAPKSVSEALDLFFGMEDGRLANLTMKKRKDLSDNIILSASGSKRRPCISIIDKGEGQQPDNFEFTFLSLSGSNKVRTPYVQGKFNMGSTGALEFCGDLNLQLILSKRHPTLVENEDNPYWGFTIVRKFEPKEGVKIASYKYLLINGRIPKFREEFLKLIPQDGTMENYAKKLEYGTFIKMYNYVLPKNMKSQIKKGLYSRLNVLLPEIALPIKIFERREYKRSKYPAYLFGLYTSLYENTEVIEKKYMNYGQIHFEGSDLPFVIYIFKEGKKTEYYSKEAIILYINGQMQGFLPKSIIDSAKLTYLSGDFVLLLDCTYLSRKIQSKLFMNSRDRLRKTALRERLMSELKKGLITNEDLQQLNRDRRNKKIVSKVENKTTLIETITDIVGKTKKLTTSLALGKTISSPIDLRKAKYVEEYDGKDFPTYFRLEKEYSKRKPKSAQMNRDSRLFFSTDVVDDYFNRPKHRGKYKIMCKSHPDLNFHSSFSLKFGRGTLNLTIPRGFELGALFNFSVTISDVYNLEPFENDFWIEIVPYQNTKSGNGKRKPPLKNKGNDQDSNDELDLPTIILVKKEKWSEYGFDEYSGLFAKDAGKNGFDIYINMDNFYLLNELKMIPGDKITEYKEMYKLLMIVSTISLIDKIKNDDNIENKSEEIEKCSRFYSRTLSLVGLPLIKTIQKGLS